MTRDGPIQHALKGFSQEEKKTDNPKLEDNCSQPKNPLKNNIFNSFSYICCLK